MPSHKRGRSLGAVLALPPQERLALAARGALLSCFLPPVGRRQRRGALLAARPGNAASGGPVRTAPALLLAWLPDSAAAPGCPRRAPACSRCSPPAHWLGIVLSEHQQHTLESASRQFSPGAAENPAVGR